MGEWSTVEEGFIAVVQLGEHYRRYRLPDPEAEADMVHSLRRYGQLAPLVVCRREETAEVIDGFKRLAAARVLDLATLRVRWLDADERLAKAALYGLNCTGQRPRDWEEAWIVYALVRQDGLTQLEVAELLGRHKSWVCRRLALVEKLADEAKEDLRLGLLSTTAARCLVQLPRGNQPEVLATLRREELSVAELAGMVELLQAAPGRSQEEYILAHPRQALRQARQDSGWAHDPRLSRSGNRVSRRLGQLLEQLARMENWLRHSGRADLSLADRGLLAPGFGRLAHAAHSVAVLTEDFLGELPTHERAHPQ
jgi:ParB-like chromosome segregation protein Spo0J